MELDYEKIGLRIARCRKRRGLTQAQVEELADLGEKYLSNIERAVSIPSIEVIMRIAMALETTPDEFLVGSAHTDQRWKDIAQHLRTMDEQKLDMAESFLTWLNEKQ